MTGFDILTLPHLLANAARLYPNKLAVIDAERERSSTYVELYERALKLANALHERGVRKGDKVAYMSHDRLECVELLYAVNLLGAIWVPQNYRFSPDELIRQMDHCDAEVLFVDERCIEVVIVALPKLTKLRPGGLISIGTAAPAAGWADYESVVTGGSLTPVDVEVGPADICGIIYTSGTTGVPKGVMHSHRSFIGWAMVPVLQNTVTAEDVFMNVYPMFHMGGTVLCVVSVLAGCSMVVLGSFEPQRWLENVERHKVSITCAVPTIMNAITKLPKELLNRFDLASLKRLATSGAPFLTETQDATLRLFPGVKLYSYYSATEVFQSMLLPEDHARKQRCVGPAAYGMELRIIGDDGLEVPAGEAGVIYARGISVCEGYYKNPEATAKAFSDGWVTSDDIGYFDAEGYLYVVDRKNDIINSGGEKIFSPEVEGYLLKMTGVADVAVIGVPDEFWGERVHAVLTLLPDVSMTNEDVLAWCRDNIPGYKKPRSAEIRSALPKSPVGKILKREIRNEYWTDAKVKI